MVFPSSVVTTPIAVPMLLKKLSHTRALFFSALPAARDFIAGPISALGSKHNALDEQPLFVQPVLAARDESVRRITRITFRFSVCSR